MWITRLRWPQTWSRRFALVTAIYQPVLFLGSILGGWLRGLTLVDAMGKVWIFACLTGVTIALVQATLGRPGVGIWRSVLRQDSAERT